MQKRGLSDIVTMVIIIVAAMASVIIIWNFLQPVLKNSAIDTQQYTSQLSIPDEFVRFDGQNLSVRVEREAGEGDIVGFLVGLEGPDGQVKTFRQNLTIRELETKYLDVNYSDQFTTDIVSVSITPIYKNNQTGKEIIGQPIAEKPTKYKLPSDLVAHWKFDSLTANGEFPESGGSLMFAARRNNLNTVTLDTSTTPPVGSGSMSVTGSPTAYAFVNDGPPFNLPQQFTIVAWARPKNNPFATAEIIRKGTGNGFSLRLTTAGQWQFYSGGAPDLNADTAASMNSWNFIAASLSSTQKTIHFNGVSKSSPISSYTPGPGSVLMGTFFNGNIDEVMIFRRELTAQEVDNIRLKYKG